MRIFDKIEEILAAACLIVMTILTFANVVVRYLFSASFSFSEEITTYLFVLLSMLGTAIAAKRRAHLGLSIVTDADHRLLCGSFVYRSYFLLWNPYGEESEDSGTGHSRHAVAGMDLRFLCTDRCILCDNTVYTGSDRRD